MRPSNRPLRAILFDRDDTLIEDVPYNGDPERVRAMPTAQEAVELARDAGLHVGVVSNQSGIARGLITAEQVEAVNRRVDALFGPFDVWRCCPHAERDRCRCRKPQPGLVLSACRALQIAPQQVAVIGDIGSDVRAALAAGAASTIVPTERTLAHEVAAAPRRAESLRAAVEALVSQTDERGAA